MSIPVGFKVFLVFLSGTFEEDACGTLSVLVFIPFLLEKLSNSSWAEIVCAVSLAEVLCSNDLIPVVGGVGDSFNTRTLCALRV